MYPIFFTINCVEQLTFFKTFVDQFQFEQSLICYLKVKLLQNNFLFTYGRWFLIFNQFSLFWHLLKSCRAVVFSCQPVFLSYHNSRSWTSPYISFKDSKCFANNFRLHFFRDTVPGKILFWGFASRSSWPRRQLDRRNREFCRTPLKKKKKKLKHPYLA